MLEVALEALSVSPDLTGVVLRPSDYGVSLVVELARENLVAVSLKDLQHLSGVYVPKAGSVIESRR